MGEGSLELGLDIGRGDAWPRGAGTGAGGHEGRGVEGGKCPQSSLCVLWERLIGAKGPIFRGNRLREREAVPAGARGPCSERKRLRQERGARGAWPQEGSWWGLRCHYCYLCLLLRDHRAGEGGHLSEHPAGLSQVASPLWPALPQVALRLLRASSV